VEKTARNLDPALHPFARAREYVRAVNATKLERVFAAPFITQLGRGHEDGVYAFAKDPNSLERFASGSGDGVVKVWDLSDQSEIWRTQAHSGIVKSMAWTRDRKLLSCSNDKAIKYAVPTMCQTPIFLYLRMAVFRHLLTTDRRLYSPYDTPSNSAPSATYFGSSGFTSISHHRSLPTFAASSSVISIYDLSRPSSSPSEVLSPNSSGTINAVSFNQVETSILASCDLDRAVCLYDLRTSSQISKATLSLSANTISWNPMEAFNFAVGSEDHNIYIFDMRNLSRSLNILKDHVAAVMCVDFSPTGEELVSASYDRTIRLWNRASGHSRDVYHTKRMQRVFCAAYTPDSKYVLSGSDDGNIRLWRAHASERSGIKSARQRQKLEYDAALIERYKHMPEIKRIHRHRHVPKQVKKAGEIKREEIKAIQRRAENRRKHSKAPPKRASEREKMVIAVD
jgi:WD repeat and SOF domain-containing protein 1